MTVNRFDVYLANLDPTIGSEIQKTRPCLIISPDEMNRNIRTVIIAPLTTAERDYPTRISCRLNDKEGKIVLDQIRTIDKTRLIRKIGVLDSDTQIKVISLLQCMFAFWSWLVIPLYDRTFNMKIDILHGEIPEGARTHDPVRLLWILKMINHLCEDIGRIAKTYCLLGHNPVEEIRRMDAAYPTVGRKQAGGAR
jgi:mRNA interferase MazF